MSKHPTPGDPEVWSEPAEPAPVGWPFVALYALAYFGTQLVFLAPLLVTLALKVNALVGIDRAPAALGLVTGIGSFLALVANPLFGRLSDRTTAGLGMRRPWLVVGLLGGSLGIATVALAPNIPVVLVGWCLAQLMLNALLAALVAVLPDQVPQHNAAWSPGSWASACPSPPSAPPLWCSCSPDTCWRCSPCRVLSAGCAS